MQAVSKKYRKIRPNTFNSDYHAGLVRPTEDDAEYIVGFNYSPYSGKIEVHTKIGKVGRIDSGWLEVYAYDLLRVVDASRREDSIEPVSKEGIDNPC
jgi:hypothetical protein